MKKSKMLIFILLLATFTILSACNNKKRPAKVIQEEAEKFIDELIKARNDPEFPSGDFKIIDSKITKLEKLAVFDDIIDYPIEVWNLEFKLKPSESNEGLVGSGNIIEDGWITEDNDMGRTCLVFKIEGSKASVLDAVQAREFDFNSLSKQEIRVRNILTNKGFLPKGAYEGNHIIIRFSIFNNKNIELFLSQPVIQGEEGIWTVEKWKEEGYVNNVYPGIDARRTDIRINEKYEELQDDFTSGEDLSLGDPIEVAMSFIKYKLRQVYSRKIQVEERDLEVISPGTMENFLHEVEFY